MSIHTGSPNELPSVFFVPGGVMPADLAYGPLLTVIKGECRAILKELEVYAADFPPPGYDLDLEVEGIRRVADAAGARRFHLVGYSAGGASSLAFTARFPERLASLALIEPAWIGSLTADDAQDWQELQRVMALPPDKQMSAFMSWQVRPGVSPPRLPLPPGPPPAWMAKRPAGLQAFFRAFQTYTINQEAFRQFQQPVYFALGSLSTRFYERAAKTLGTLFPNLTVEEYEGRSHMDPPHRAEPDRFARALRDLWARGDTLGVGRG